MLKIFKKKKFISEHIIPGDHIEIMISSGIYKVLSVHGPVMLLKSLRTGEQREYMQSNYKCHVKH